MALKVALKDGKGVLGCCCCCCDSTSNYHCCDRTALPTCPTMLLMAASCDPEAAR